MSIRQVGLFEQPVHPASTNRPIQYRWGSSFQMKTIYTMHVQAYVNNVAFLKGRVGPLVNRRKKVCSLRSQVRLTAIMVNVRRI